MREDILDVCENFELGIKEFTQILKAFQKKHGDKYKLKIENLDATLIFNKAIACITHEKNTKESRYNALRFIKFSLNNEETHKTNFKRYLDLILVCLEHSYGNLPLEALHLLRDFRWRTTFFTEPFHREKMTKKIQANCDYYWPIVIEFYFSLIDKNFYYEMVNEDTLDKRDLATTEYIPYSGDTKDKYLKHIRQGIEHLDYPGFEDKIREYGYIK